jgi:hypothetical protein
VSEEEQVNLLQRETDLLDRFTRRINQQNTFAKRITDWWKPLGILVLIITLWTKMNSRVETLEVVVSAHQLDNDIHANNDSKKLLILSETKELRDTLNGMSANQIRLIQSVDSLKEEVQALKKTMLPN